MALEGLVLDGLSLNDGTTFIIKHDGFSAPPPRERQDWIGAADSEDQKLFRAPLHENRKVTARIVVLPQASMDVALDKIGLVRDKLKKASQYPDGIPLTWTPDTSTRTVTFDVLSGEISDLPIDLENGWFAKSPQFTIELTCKPYWRGTEVLTSTASSSTPIVTLEIPSVTGDVPALGRLIVTDTASQSRRHVEWGLEGLYYTPGSPAALLLDSDSLVTSGFAGVQTGLGGFYDPNATGNNAINATVYTNPVAVCGTGDQPHVGVFRVKGRVVSGTAPVSFRFSWKAADGPFTSNAWVVPRGVNTLEEVDFGTITIPPAVVGGQRWTGRVEAFVASGAVANAAVDYLVLIPVLEGYGKARAIYTYAPGVVVGQDSFVGTTAGSALGTRAAPTGGSWATSGDTTDFAFSDAWAPGDTTESITRSTTGAETTGRFAILGSTNYTDTQVDVRARITFTVSSASGNQNSQSLIARWTDANNHLRLVVPGPASGLPATLEQVVAGTVTVLATSTFGRPPTQTAYRFRLLVFASGRAIGQIMSDAGSVLAVLDASSTALATAGALATGKPGLRDYSFGTNTGTTRRLTEFAVATPAPEPITLYSGRNMQIRYDDVIRQDSTGTYTGRPQSYRGSRFLVPVGTSRVLVKARRNDIDATLDANVTDATQIQVAWQPRGLAVPR